MQFNTKCIVSFIIIFGALSFPGKNLLLDLQRKLYIIKVRWQVKKGRKNVLGFGVRKMGYRRTYRIHESGKSKTDPDLNSNPKLTLRDTGGHTKYMKVASLKLTLTLSVTVSLNP